MPAPISIVIPTLNAAPVIGQTLSALFEGVNSGLVQELIFADGGSSDDTAKIAEGVGAEFIECPKGRGNQLSFAIEQSKAPWIMVVHADTILSEGWAAIIRAHISTSDKAGYGKLAFDSGGVMAFVTSNWANIRSRIFGLPYGDQMLVLSKSLYKSVGGYPDIPLMEDVAIAQALRGKLTPLKITARTSASRYQKDGWILRGTRNLATLVRYFLGQNPVELAQRYKR